MNFRSTIKHVLRIACGALMILAFVGTVNADPFTIGALTITVAMEVQAAIAAASLLASYLLTRKKSTAMANVDRGKVNDIRASVPGYGEFIPKGWGLFRIAPIWIWESPAVDHPVTTPGHSGGKMPSGGAPTATTVDHVYLKSVAGVFNDGEIYGGVRRIWFDNDLVAVFHDLDATKYEAEWGVLSGGAAVATQAECSGGRKVTGIGGAVTYPTDISGCKLWLKADSLSLNDGDAVTTWTDSSGNARDATQATAGLKPIYKTNVINGQPVIRFDGTDDRLVTSSVAVAGGAFSAFIVLKFASTSGAQYPLFNGDNVAGNGWALESGAGTAGKRGVLYRGNAISDDGTTSTITELWSVTRTSAPSLNFYLNGTITSIAADASALTAPTNKVVVGGDSGGSAGFFNGDIAEIIIFDSALSTGNRQAIESYLAGKYSISGPTPAVTGKCTLTATTAAADYELAVHYTSSSALTYNVYVDGSLLGSITCPSSGGSTIVALATYASPITLTAGDHLFRFENTTAACPDLDCIDLAIAQTAVAADPRAFTSTLNVNNIPPANQNHGWAYNNHLPDPGDGGGAGGAAGTPHQTFNLGKYGQPSIRIYRGTTTQNADSAIVAQEGAASVPAYRGWSYLVIEGCQLQGGRFPNVTLEVNQGCHSLPVIVTDIYGLVGVTPSQLDVTNLTGLVLGTSVVAAGTYVAPTYANTANETHAAGGVIHKTSGANHAWNAYAAGTTSIASGVNGAIRFTADVGPILVGLGTDSSPTVTTDVLCGIILNTTSYPSLETKNGIQFWNGTTQGPDIGVWAKGDSFQFEIRNGRFRVYQNGIEIQSFTPSVPAYPLFPQIMMYDTGAGVSALTVSTSGAIGDAPSSDAGGLLLSSRKSAADLLNDLQTRFQFDMVEVDGVVKAILRNGSTADITIPYADMRAVEASPGQLPEIPAWDCQITDIDPFLLPGRVDVNYLDPGMDYHNNVQSEMVLAGSRYDQQSVSLSIIDQADNMKKLAITLMHKAEMEGRAFNWLTSWKYLHVHPGTICSLTLPNATHTVRVVQGKYPLPVGVLEFSALRQAASLYSPTASGSISSGFEKPLAPVPQNTRGVIIDGPILRAEDAGDGTQPVVYVAMCGRGAGAWSGGYLYEESPIGSANYELLTTASQASQIGVAAGTLATVSDPSIWDRTNTLTINFYTLTTLSSASEQDLRSNGNLNLLILSDSASQSWEAVQFKTAVAGVAVAPYLSSYTVSVFLRGRFGSDSNVGSHVSSEDVVVVDSTLRPRRMNVTDIGR